jgi:sedoheptulose-bisphosphatase
LNVDVLAEDLIRSALANCSSIYAASSEEDPVERKVEHSGATSEDNGEKYTVAFDPLDGSSIIAPNWTVGTIIGIWNGETALNQDPSKQIAAILGVVGPRTTAIVALRIPGCKPTCFEVAIEDGQNEGSFLVLRENIQLQSPPFKTRYFAPANMRAAAEEPKYMKLINHFIAQKYTLRYSGGLVPDVVHALVKGHGVYISPVTEQSKAKLRMLFELAPVALIIECAGGLAIDSSDGKKILEKPVKDIDARGGLICGTTEEVEFVRTELISE